MGWFSNTQLRTTDYIASYALAVILKIKITIYFLKLNILKKTIYD